MNVKANKRRVYLLGLIGGQVESLQQKEQQGREEWPSGDPAGDLQLVLDEVISLAGEYGVTLQATADGRTSQLSRIASAPPSLPADKPESAEEGRRYVEPEILGNPVKMETVDGYPSVLYTDKGFVLITHFGSSEWKVAFDPTKPTWRD